MGDREKLVVVALATLLLFLAPAYLVHVSPRFAGSLGGAILGISAALLMLLALVYPAVKYVGWLRSRVTRHVTLGRLLSLHVYGGLLAALLAVLHSGHKYQSGLGIALILAIIVVVATGFIGRYYLGFLATRVREQQALLGTLRGAYNRRAEEGDDGDVALAASGVPVLSLVGAIADVEYSLAARDALRRLVARWMVAHTLASLAFYALLLLHIWSGIYFGLRWLA